jgi:hypothetical protein
MEVVVSHGSGGTREDAADVVVDIIFSVLVLGQLRYFRKGFYQTRCISRPAMPESDKPLAGHAIEAIIVRPGLSQNRLSEHCGGGCPSCQKLS